MQSNKKNFKGQNIYVGIDVHLKTWSVTVRTPSNMQKTHAQKASAPELFEYLRRNYPGGVYHLVYESGFSGFSTHYAFKDLGVDCIVTHAADVPVTQKDRVTKSDRVDSARLAKALQDGDLRPLYIHRRENLDDRSLIRYRLMLISGCCAYKSRIKHLLHNNGVEYPESLAHPSSHWSRRFIGWLKTGVRLLSESRVTLDRLIEEVEYLRRRLLETNRLIRAMAASPKYARDYGNLVSIPGIGCVVAMTLLTETGDTGRFHNERAFASYLGLVPVMQASGAHEYVGEKTFRGNRHLGPKIIEASWIAVRHDPTLAAKFGDLCKRMNKNEAIVRIARKLSNIIYSILKNGERYECR